jgi:predicted outer membrane protein
MRAAAVTALVAAIAAVALAGCGKESRHDVKQAVQQLSSISSEGAIMADDLARDRTKTTFVRVHGEELSSQAEHEAEKLNDAPVTADLHAKVERAIELSSQIGGAIDDLRVSPHDRAGARQTERDLRRFAQEASDLADTL